MHDSVRDMIRHFVGGHMHCDKAIINSVVATRPTIDPLVATSLQIAAGRQTSRFLPVLSNDEPGPWMSGMPSRVS